MKILTGTVHAIKAFDSGFVIAQLTVSGEPQPITLVGTLPHLAVGEAIEAHGDWTDHPRYGRQFKVTQVQAAPLTSLAGLVKYLGSGLIKGVGEGTAAKVVAQFGEDTLRVLDQTPERLAGVKGIGKKKAAAIVTSWQEHQAERTAMIWLQGYGVSPRLALKIYACYGAATVATVQASPYCLERDIPGVGFLTADRVARAMGVPEDAGERVAAGMSYVLEQAAQEGHVYLPFNVLTQRAGQTLGVDENHADDMLRVRLVADASLVSESAPGTRRVYLKAYHVAEVGLAERLRQLTAPGLNRFWSVANANWPALIATLAANEAIQLTERQAAAVQAAFTRTLTVLTGGPGTGKTTCLRAVVRLAQAAGFSVALASPTGRAAQRLAEATGVSAQTIHRLLEVDPTGGLLNFKRHERAPLAADLIIVDEASMLDLLLAHHLLKAIGAGAHLMLVGDVDQLPSVGAGNVLRDVIAAIEGTTGGREQGSGDRNQGTGVRDQVSGNRDQEAGDRGQGAGRPLPPDSCAVVRLDTIFRQVGGSYIITNAHRINRGELPALDNRSATDFFLFREEDPAKAADLVVELVAERIPRKFGCKPEDIQVLSPMHRGTVGVAELNRRLQAALNPPAGMDLVSGERVFRPGDRVMQTVNDYQTDVFNGDMGAVLAVAADERRLSVDFNGAVVSYGNGDLDHLLHAYAVTIHKSQGSEFPVVVIPLLAAHYIMLQRNLLYTAITRARQLVVLVGDPQAISVAVRNAKVEQRYSGLVERLESL